MSIVDLREMFLEICENTGEKSGRALLAETLYSLHSQWDPDLEELSSAYSWGLSFTTPQAPPDRTQPHILVKRKDELHTP